MLFERIPVFLENVFINFMFSTRDQLLEIVENSAWQELEKLANVLEKLDIGSL